MGYCKATAGMDVVDGRRVAVVSVVAAASSSSGSVMMFLVFLPALRLSDLVYSGMAFWSKGMKAATSASIDWLHRNVDDQVLARSPLQRRQPISRLDWAATSTLCTLRKLARGLSILFLFLIIICCFTGLSRTSLPRRRCTCACPILYVYFASITGFLSRYQFG